MDHHTDKHGIFDATGCLSARGMSAFSAGQLSDVQREEV